MPEHGHQMNLAAVDIVARKDRMLMIRKHILEKKCTECNCKDA